MRRGGTLVGECNPTSSWRAAVSTAAWREASVDLAERAAELFAGTDPHRVVIVLPFGHVRESV